ncbi:MAG: Holliday junction branch migration protein RuvA [Chitinophagaceae bacterium]
MIAFLKGAFVQRSPSQVVIEVQGIGYEVQISLNTYAQIHHLQEGLLYTHLQIKEDAHTLFGFADLQEKELFIQLISVSGVGAATARMMLSSLKPEELMRAIQQGQTRQLESIKGIGKKSAERIILELRDKMSKISSPTNISPLINNTLEQDALNALVALGIGRGAGEQAVQKVLQAEPSLDRVEEIIKKALKTL